ncbi:MAG: slipin family protein [Candidatus Diapherotrites archaeon]|nr:slipin family protein [Candidatus Diapherotrites archaeon]
MVLLYFNVVLGVVFAIFVVLSSMRIIMQYQKAVKFRLGKYVGLLEPGFNMIVPFIEGIKVIDTRITTSDIPKQEVMTRDNVPVMVNAVLYFKVNDPVKAVLEIERYRYAVSQYALTALRDVIGGVTLDTVLAERDKVAEEIKKIVDVETDPWGIDVTSIKIQDMELPSNMKRTMAKEAEAEREKRATILKAEGDMLASDNYVKAAKNLANAPGALYLRTLQTLNDISSDQSNTIVLPVPMDMYDVLSGLRDHLYKSRPKAKTTTPKIVAKKRK